VRSNALVAFVCVGVFDRSKNLVRRGNDCVVAIEDDSHLLKSVASGLWVCEPDGKKGNDSDGNEDQIVLPGDAAQRDWVDKDVEEQRKVGGAENDRNTTSSEGKSPDLGRIGYQQSTGVLGATRYVDG
jgi:hypothetical protein